MLVGEQPGDGEDRAGLPFVGPAGRVLEAALEEAGIDRRRVYITNAVKHFKNVPRGKRRIHQRPNRYEVERCRWWLQLELELVRPRLTLALGATAAAALAGRTLVLSRVRGRPITFATGLEGMVTVHPSYILRLRGDAKAEEHSRFVADLAELGRRVPEVLRPELRGGAAAMR